MAERTLNKLNNKSVKQFSRALAIKDPHLDWIYKTYGPPPLWDRPPGFSTLLYIILEQQVSLASAKACFGKLCDRLGEVTPENVLALDDAELKTIGFSRQKTATRDTWPKPFVKIESISTALPIYLTPKLKAHSSS